MSGPFSGASLEPEMLHRLKNHLAIVISYSELLLQDLDPADPNRGDIAEINKAGRQAADLIVKLYGTANG